MTEPRTSLPEEILRNYFHAKDENRPHFLADTFQSNAVLEVRNHSEAISFPAVTEGRDGIADVLVRRFGQTHENIYSFYLRRPSGMLDTFSCDWLVAMTEKADLTARVGCGRYDWTFSNEPPCLASRLVITISSMEVLPRSTTNLVLEWILGLPYPWTTVDQVHATAPGIPALEAVLRTLQPI